MRQPIEPRRRRRSAAAASRQETAGGGCGGHDLSITIELRLGSPDSFSQCLRPEETRLPVRQWPAHSAMGNLSPLFGRCCTDDADVGFVELQRVTRVIRRK